MTNEKNLTHKLTVEEQRRGGKKSGEARKNKKTVQTILSDLLDGDAKSLPQFMAVAKKLGVMEDKSVKEMFAAVCVINSYKTANLSDLERDTKLLGETNLPADPKKYSGLPASMIAPAFAAANLDIDEHAHLEYVFPGGRGSTKSSFCGSKVVDLIMSTDDVHAVCVRQVANTLKDSVFSKIKWAISAMGLDDEFDVKVSPLEITKKSTGQKIYFRGADDPGKIKSIAPEFGYIGILWFEELDQYAGPEAVRNIEQSVIRGGDVAYIFKSFNPPKSAQNWANKYIKIPRADRLVTESTYLSVPSKWLG